MVSQQLSFHIIERPAGVSSSHTCLVVSGRGVPHELLTVFYEELQKIVSVPVAYSVLQPLLSFFSFLEQPDQTVWTRACSHEPYSSHLGAVKRCELPQPTYWAGPPSEIQAAVRVYLFVRWGCRTRSQGQYEEVQLPAEVRATEEIECFLAALRQFYRFAIERQDYWYYGNPAAAFRVSLRARLWQAIAAINSSLRSRPAQQKSEVDVAGKEEVLPGVLSFSSHQEQPLPAVPTQARSRLAQAA